MKRALLLGLALASFLTSCSTKTDADTEPEQEEMKINVYQVFTRLFGNTNTTNKQANPCKTNQDCINNSENGLKTLS